jgi:hypothetical protein
LAETALKFYIATASWLVQIIIAQENLDDMSYGDPSLAAQYEVSGVAIMKLMKSVPIH